MKFCPQCNHQLIVAPEVCPECGFVLITLGSKTLGDEDITREVRSDQAAPTLLDGNVSISGATNKKNDQDSASDPTSSRTIKIPDKPWISPRVDGDEEISFELDNKSDATIIGPGDRTFGRKDQTTENRNGLTDQSDVTLNDDNVSSSDRTIKQTNQDDDQDPSSLQTIQIPDEPRATLNSDKIDVDDDTNFELADDDDLSFEIDLELDEAGIEPDDSTIGPGEQTILVNPMQTMVRPEADGTLVPTSAQKKPRTVKASGSQAKTLQGQRLPTIVNPQAALEAAEEYSKGLQSLIPPRTIVRKEQVADSSDYQLLKRIGSGAYGTVFRAKQVPLERSVAIKLLQNSVEDEQHQQRIKNEFLREAQFTGRLEHPNIVPIHDIGLTVSPKGKVNPFYVMKEIRGKSWLEEIRTKSLDENLEVFKNVTNAIAFAHSQNILHCDLKPDNVMLGEFGEVLVVDWGQAVDLSAPDTMRPGGTPAYISPEMAQYWIDIYLLHRHVSPAQAKVGYRSDVYLLGALLFEIITGTAPHCRSTRKPPYEVIRAAAKNYIVDYPDTVNKNLMNIALRALRATDDDHIDTTGDLLVAVAQHEKRSLSIQLRQRAQQLLEQAKADADYDYFQRSRFGFEEALEKWDGNDEARRGLRDAKLSCAEQALEHQNFDLGLDVLEKTTGDRETELRKQLTVGKRARDRRKRLVARLAYGLVGSILLGILINGIMIYLNRASLIARDAAVKELVTVVDLKQKLDESIGPMKAEIDTFPDKLAAQDAELTELYRAKEERLKLEQAELRGKLEGDIDILKDDKESLAVDKKVLVEENEALVEDKETLVVEKETLADEKETLADEKQILAGQVVELNESSKLLRYKGGLTQISTDLQSGNYRNARRALAQYKNQQDWEVRRLNLLAHPEIKSLYLNEPINSMSATTDGQQVAIAFADRIEIRSIDRLDQPAVTVKIANGTAVAISPDGNQLYVGKPASSQDSAGQIEVFDLTQQGQAESVRTMPAQSEAIDLIEVNEAANAVLSVGKTSALRQSSGQGLEEPLMVWIDGKKMNVKMVLPNGAKLKFDCASFSNDGQRILLTNRTGLPREQHAHVFERSKAGYQWIASSPIQGISAATFTGGSSNEVIAGIQNANTGGYSLARWNFATSSPTNTVNTNEVGSVTIIAPLTSKLNYLRQQGDFLIATEDDRQTTIWDWRNKKSIKLKGQSRPADFGIVKPGESLETCTVVTAAIGEQPEILSINLASYQPEFQRESVGWTPEDRPASVTAMYIQPAAEGGLQAFGNDYGMAAVFRNRNLKSGVETSRDGFNNHLQWNIGAWQYHIASDDFIFAQSAEDYLYQYDRSSGALERVLTKLARYLNRREQIVDLQVSDDGRVALVKTTSDLPKFLLWDLQQDELIREVDYGQQDLFGTRSKKQLPKLALSRDGRWVIGAKVGVFGWPVDSGQLVRFDNDNTTAARSIANSIVFVRNSQQVLVSWRNRIIQFDLDRRQQVEAYSLPQISDAKVQNNLLDAIEDAGAIYVLADENKARGGILLLSLKNKQQLAKFQPASFASFYTTENGVAAIAGGLDDNSKVRLSTWDSTQKRPQGFGLPALEDSALARHIVGFERVFVSPQHGILLQTTERNRGSAKRMWNSVAINVDLPLSVKGQVSLGHLRAISKPTIKQIVAKEKQAATLANGQVMFWKLSKTGVKPDGVLDVWATTMQLAPDSNTLVVSTDDNRCVLYSFPEREKLGEFNLTSNVGDVTAMAWRPDSETIAIGRSTGTIEVLLLNEDNFSSSKSVVLKLNTPINHPISQLAYSQTGALLATAAGQGIAVLIRATKGDAADIQDPAAALTEMVYRCTDEQTILMADISADGNRIVSGANTGQITIWNSETVDQHPTNKVLYSTDERELLSLPTLHQSPISVVRFADGLENATIYSAEKDSGKNEFISWPSAGATTKQEDALRSK